jgi:nucleoside-diphosphate-sugar epimerase/predicted dehydrogenase
VRALVTGATGFIGEHLVRALISEGHNVRVLARDPKKTGRLPADVDVRLGDITDASSLTELMRDIDVVFHLAAAVSGPWERHRNITVEGTRRLVRAAAASGVKRFVHVSSLAVYDRARIGPDVEITEESPLWEDLNAAGPYARGKIEAERIVRQEALGGTLDFVIARPGLVYGPGHVIFEHLGKRLGQGLFLPLGGSGVRLPLVHVGSVADALLRLAECPAAPGRAFNIVDQEQATKAQYIRLLSKANCRTYRCVGLPAAPLTAAARVSANLRSTGRAPWLPRLSPEKPQARTTEHRYDSSALREATGWHPVYGLEQGLHASFESPQQRQPVEVRRVGIIGAGRMADFHIRALRGIRGVEVSGVLDVNPDAATSLAKRWNLPVATANPEEFYARAHPESVHILTPPQSHAPLALDAIGRGIHVLLEKPMAISLAECDALQDAAARHGVTIGVNHNFVTDRRIRRARALIEGAAIGDLVHIDIVWAFDMRRFQHMLVSEAGEPGWALRLPGGPLEDLAPHPLSLALLLVNEEVHPSSIHTFRSGRLEHAFDDELRLLLAGRRATVSLAMTLSASPDDMTISIYGTQGTLRLDVQNLLMIHARQGRGPKAVARGLRVLAGGAGTISQTVRNVGALALKRADPPGSPRALVQEHYAALAKGSPLPADVLQGRRVVEIVRAVWPGLTDSPPAGRGADALSPRTTVSARHANSGSYE